MDFFTVLNFKVVNCPTSLRNRPPYGFCSRGASYGEGSVHETSDEWNPWAYLWHLCPLEELQKKSISILAGLAFPWMMHPNFADVLGLA